MDMWVCDWFHVYLWMQLATHRSHVCGNSIAHRHTNCCSNSIPDISSDFGPDVLSNNSPAHFVAHNISNCGTNVLSYIITHQLSH